ncbi:MAG: hypothetical protein PVG78_13130 [Desulfobacterales bacterium]
MQKDIIDIDNLPGEQRDRLEQLMLLVPPSDRDDMRLRRLLLFRLRLDGFPTTRGYLVDKVRSADRCRFFGSFYDYLKDDVEEKACFEEGERNA